MKRRRINATGAIDPVFIMRYLGDKFMAKNKELRVCLIDMEKAFDRILEKPFGILHRTGVQGGGNNRECESAVKEQ